MKPYINIRVKRFWIDLGWYDGEYLALLKLELFQTEENQRGKIDHVTIFQIQILKLFIGFGFS